MSAKRKKEAPAPARDEAGAEAGSQDQTTALPSVGRESPVLEEKWADPWAAAKAAGFLVDRVVQKCQSTGAKRCPNGIWKVTPEVLVALGAPADRALAAVETAMEHRRALDDGRTEGAVVYAVARLEAALVAHPRAGARAVASALRGRGGDQVFGIRQGGGGVWPVRSLCRSSRPRQSPASSSTSGCQTTR